MLRWPLSAMTLAWLNFSDGSVDFYAHPNFSSGVMEFGLANEFSVDLSGSTDVAIDLTTHWR